jgi:EAL and modified HD-GYP domain-containing signal transduction protein
MPSISEQGPSQALEITIQGGSIETTGNARYVARQPILDLRGRIHGYELLYRKGTEKAFFGDCELASRTVLDDTVLFGVERFTDGSLAFINCTSETLTDDLVSVLPSSMAVLELLETVEPSEELIAACVRLKSQGFKIALDDFVWAPKFAPLVDLADYIKVDFLLTPAEKRRELLHHLKGRRLKLLAEKVETQEEYAQARFEGFTLFQGYYFCHPELMKSRKIPSNHLCHFEILRLLQRDLIDWEKLSHAVKRDESLTYRLLRLINSVGYAVREEISSVQAAMIFLGEETFRRIAMLAIATELNTGRPPEILKMAMIRARFCELAARSCGCSPNEQYLLGMLSLLSAMLAAPMEELTPGLPLRKEIREALQGALNRESRMLQWLLAYECGDWDQCEAIVESSRLRQQQVNQYYTEAVYWADRQFRLVN